MKLFRKMLLEILGTCIIVFIGCSVSAFTLSSSSSFSNVGANMIGTSLAVGCSVMVVLSLFGKASGAHCNPAISLGVLFENFAKPKEERTFGWKEFFAYFGAQLLGAYIGCVGVFLCAGNKVGFAANVVSETVLSTRILPTLNAFFYEIIATSIIVLTYIIMNEKKHKKFMPLIVGAAFIGCTLLGTAIDGAGLNPAKSIMTAFWTAFGQAHDFTALSQVWIYIIGPLLGACLAGTIYAFIHTWIEEKKEEPKPEVAPVVNNITNNYYASANNVKVEKPAETKPAREKPKVAAAKKRNDIVPFEVKMKKASKDLQAKYHELADYAASYGIKSRVSIASDTYRLHKIRYVVITIRGNALKVHFALDPKDYSTSPFIIHDDSKKVKYVDVPAYIKVKSDLSLKRAKALIDDTMVKAGFEKKD